MDTTEATRTIVKQFRELHIHVGKSYSVKEEAAFTEALETLIGTLSEPKAPETPPTDWRDTHKTIDAKAAELGLTFPDDAKTKDQKIALVVAELAKTPDSQ